MDHLEDSKVTDVARHDRKPLGEFILERFFSKYEFTAPFLACCSDCQPLKMAELICLADPETHLMWDELGLGYTETQGLPALRHEVAGLYTTVSADQVVVLTPEEGIYLAMQAIVRPGDHVVHTYPGYQSLFAVAESLGASLSRWEPSLGPGAAVTWDVDQLKALLRPTTRMLVVNFPHNPTGTSVTLSQWQEVVDACRAAGTILFSDEMYRMLELDPASRLPAAVDVYERGVSLSGVSKTLGCPGLRIGWLAARNAQVLGRVRELKDWTTICSSAPSEVLALMALRARPVLLAANLSRLHTHVDLVDQFMMQLSDFFEWSAPVASPCSFPRLKTGERIDAFCDRLVQATGVLLLPASVYQHDKTTEAGFFRLGLGRDNLPECLARIREFLQGGGVKVQHSACLAP